MEEALTEIETQSERISQIVNRVRSYAKSEKRRHRPIQLQLVIDQAIASFRKTSLSKDVIFTYPHAEKAMLSGDALELELLFVNLLKNAAVAMQPLPSDAKRIRIRTKTGGAMISVTFEDNGPTVTDAVMEKLSSPMKSASSNGLGLGLTICRLIAEEHGGSIHFTKAVPNGLTVTVSLPLAETALKDENYDY